MSYGQVQTSSGSGSVSQTVLPSIDPSVASLQEMRIQLEGHGTTAAQKWYSVVDVSGVPTATQLMQLAVTGPTLNVSAGGAANTGAITTGNISTVSVLHSVSTQRFFSAAGYLAMTDGTADTSANTLDAASTAAANWAVLQYNKSAGALQLSVSTDSSGHRIWTSLGSGGTSSATPAGTNTQVQYNSSGALGASADFTYSSSAQRLIVLGVTATAAIIAGSGYVQADGGFLVTASNTAYNSVQTHGGMYAALGYTSDQAFYPKLNSSAPNTPGSGYSGWAYQGGSTFWYYNSTSAAWATVDLSTTGAGVTSLSGTANQITVSMSTGAVTLSMPATINVATFNSTATGTGLAFQAGSGNFAVTADGNVSGAAVANFAGGFTSAGFANMVSGYKVNGTTVIDSSRFAYLNQTSVTGSVTATGGYNCGGSAVTYPFDYTNGSSAFLVDTAGNVSATGQVSGVAFVSSAAQFFTASSNSTNATYMVVANTSSGGHSWSVGSSGTSGPSGAGSFVFYDNSASGNNVRAWIDSAGTLNAWDVISCTNFVSNAVGAANAFQTSTSSFYVQGGGACVAASYYIGSAGLVIDGSGSYKGNVNTTGYVSAGPLYSASIGSAPGAPASGYGGMQYDSGSTWWIWNGFSYVAHDFLAGASGVTSAVAGTGVSVSSSTGAVTFSIGQSVATSASVTFGALAATSTASNAISAASGGISAAYLSATQQIVMVALGSAPSGPSSGQFSFYANSSTGINFWNGSAYVALGSISGGGVTSLAGGTGVSVGASTGAVTVSIGQNVATTAAVTFAQVSVNGNVLSTGASNFTSYLLNGVSLVNSSAYGSFNGLASNGNINVTGQVLCTGEGNFASYYLAGTQVISSGGVVYCNGVISNGGVQATGYNVAGGFTGQTQTLSVNVINGQIRFFSGGAYSDSGYMGLVFEGGVMVGYHS